MDNFISKFNTTPELTSFLSSASFQFPHVSLTKDDNTVHYFQKHDYVEIGGLKWATMNIGSYSVTDVGQYFQWGDTQGYYASQVGSGEYKKPFTLDDYKWTNDGGNTFTKYNETDGKTVLDLSDDAAYVNWGGTWRMPTSDEVSALFNATTHAWTSSYQGSGVSGIVFTDKTDSSKTLFFPACGEASNRFIISTNLLFYFTSTLASWTVFKGMSLYGDSSNYVGRTTENRYSGLPIRPVSS